MSTCTQTCSDIAAGWTAGLELVPVKHVLILLVQAVQRAVWETHL